MWVWRWAGETLNGGVHCFLTPEHLQQRLKNVALLGLYLFSGKWPSSAHYQEEDIGHNPPFLQRETGGIKKR